jgi:hypothetical protein
VYVVSAVPPVLCCAVLCCASLDGPLFKAVNGELANLRWDLPAASMPAYYGKAGRKSFTSDWQLLANFTRGLAGGGAVNRPSWAGPGGGDQLVVQ